MEVPTNKKDLRRWLNQELNSPVSDRIWQKLEDDNYVDGALYDPAAGHGRKWLKEHAYLLQCAETVEKQKHKGDWQVPERKVQPGRRDPVKMRALALSMYYGRAASYEKSVVSLRKKLLAGRLLSLQEAEDLLNSVAPCYLPYDYFVSRGIPLVGHRSEIVDVKTGRTRKKRSPSKKILRFKWANKTQDLPDIESLQADAMERGTPFSAIPGAPIVTPGSVFDDIRLVCKELFRKFGWEEPDATRFLLTSHPPFMSGISFRIAGNHSKRHPYYVIDLRIQPWVPADRVRNAYQQIQKLFYEKRNKQISSRAIQVFNFVERWRDKEPKITWNRMCEEWNALARSRGRKLFRDYRHFRQEYVRAHQSIVFRRSNKIRLTSPVEDDVLRELLAKAKEFGLLVRKS